MAIPKRKQPPKLKLTRTASTAGEPRDGSVETEPDEPDDELAEFLAAPPAAADMLHVVAIGPSGDGIVQVRTKKEVQADVDEIATRITAACERWAASERRLVRFRASWLRGERLLATHTFEHGTATTDQPVLDGTAQSFLVQMQHAQLARDKLFIESLESMARANEVTQDSWKSLLNIANKRNDALETENDKLRERLRKSDDVGNEIAMETARADIEARGRTADILEKHVIPLAQAVAVQQLRAANATPASPVAPVGQKDQ